MVVATADLDTAIVAAWNASSLDTTFAALGGTSPLLWDEEAPAGQAFPYCVMETVDVSREARMSSLVGTREVRRVNKKFSVLAKEVSGDSRTAKEIAAYLVEEVMKVYGGHPTQVPTGVVTLSNGNHITTFYDTDMGIRIEDTIYQWDISYLFIVDVPVAG
jgi:hypothetical protein